MSPAAMHVVLAAYASFHAYPATQDGPAHLYGAHILAVLRSGASTPYRDVFLPNLHPVANSLFTYWAIAVERYAPIDWALRSAFFVALVGMPLAAHAFARALRSQARPEARYRLPEQPATSLAVKRDQLGHLIVPPLGFWRCKAISTLRQ